MSNLLGWREQRGHGIYSWEWNWRTEGDDDDSMELLFESDLWMHGKPPTTTKQQQHQQLRSYKCVHPENQEGTPRDTIIILVINT